MLDQNLKNQLSAYLQNLRRPLTLVASLDDSAASQQMRELLEDVAACSSLVRVSHDGSAERRPSFAIGEEGKAPRVHFAGLPMGHEFTSLVLALLHVGGHPSKEDPELVERAKTLEAALDFEVYMSLSCHNCPDVVQSLNLIAAVNPNVRVTTIDGALFQQEVQEREIMAVPSVYLNGKPFASGRMDLGEIVTRLDTQGAAKEAAKLSEKDPFEVLVIGGGPAGAAAAVYAARKGIRTGLVAERMGGQTNDTMGIENYISVQHTTGPKFAQNLAAHVKEYGVDTMERQRIAQITPAAYEGGLIEVKTESGATLKTRSLILATGARWRNMGVPGEEQYKNKGVAYCPHCDGPLFKGKRVAVVGGGNSGVEAAIDLAGLVSHVTVIERSSQLRADAVLIDKLKSLPNVDVITEALTTEVTGDGSVVNGISYTDVDGVARHIELEGIFVQIGLVPNTEWLKGVVELNRYGEIVVDAKGHTSVPGVFAAGDATTTPYKQIIVAAGDGAKASLSAFDHLIRTPSRA